MIEIVLPWPPKECSPNARVHWSKRYRAGNRYGIDAQWCAFRASADKIDAEALDVRITFCPPDNRRRDLDNLLASIKNGIDGVASVIGVDDSKWQLTLARGEVRPHGAVVLEIAEAAE